MNKLADTLNLKSNSLNVIRLVLALLVVVFHSFPLGGFQGAASIGQMPLGTFAVASFFVVSGYLISHSRSKSSTGHYFWKRGLRIIPDFLFA
jgi:peptidoglycan/LPS O-acetylase OafA/YrhL